MVSGIKCNIVVSGDRIVYQESGWKEGRVQTYQVGGGRVQAHLARVGRVSRCLVKYSKCLVGRKDVYQGVW